MSTAGKIPNNSSPCQRMWANTNNNVLTPLAIGLIGLGTLFVVVGVFTYGVAHLEGPTRYDVDSSWIDLSLIDTPVVGPMVMHVGVPCLASGALASLPICLYKCVYRKHQDDPTKAGTSRLSNAFSVNFLAPSS